MGDGRAGASFRPQEFYVLFHGDFQLGILSTYTCVEASSDVMFFDEKNSDEKVRPSVIIFEGKSKCRPQARSEPFLSFPENPRSNMTEL